MKFLSVAVAALLGVVDAKKTISGATIQKRIREGKFDKKSLLANAKPYGRKLEENADFEITGDYSIKFNSCGSLTVADEDLFDENYIDMAKAGELVAEKSYIIFDVCKTADCYYDAGGASYITDIYSFFSAFAYYLPNQVENYCEGCRQNEDYCYAELNGQQYYAEGQEQADEADNQDQQDAEQDNADQADGQDAGDAEDADGQDAQDGGERRKLSKYNKAAKMQKSRKLAENNNVEYVQIDCYQCSEYACFDQENEQDQDQADDVVQYEFEDALTWLEALMECSELDGVYMNGNENLPLYAGLMCNGDGSGVEIGLFIDNDCGVYTTTMSYANVMAEADAQYYSMSRDIVEFMFLNTIDCYASEITYYNPTDGYDAADEDDNQDADAEDDGEAAEAAEWCQNLFEEEVYKVGDCSGDEEEQNEDEAEDENAYNYDWYTYQLTQNQAEDNGEICKVVSGLDGGSYVYKGDTSLYDYSRYNKNGKKNVSGGLSSQAIVGIVAGLLVVIAAIAVFVMRGKTPKDSKKAPLIATGAMA